MKVSDVLQHLDSLPQPQEFRWPGVEQWNDEVFDRQVKTLAEAVAYIKELRGRVANQSMHLADLTKAYNEIINWIRSIEIMK